MKIFLSADTHFNHRNIIEYCQRPFKDVEEMNFKIIENWNDLVTDEDIVYFLGDFCFGQYKCFEERLNGKIIFIKGNHDKNLNFALNSAILNFANKKIFLCHDLSYVNSLDWSNCDLILQGHIHEKWKYNKIYNHHKGKDIDIINVGVDCWDFKPILLNDIIIVKGIKNE